MSKVTIKEIAERANVSQAAVSLAMHGKKGISEQTRELILRTAQEMGYRRQRQFHCAQASSVILLLSKDDGMLLPGVLQELAAWVLQCGGQLRLYTYAQVTADTRLLDDCRLLITFDTLGRAELDQLSACVPQILVLDGDYPRKPFWNLRIDYDGAAYALTKHLSELGHRSFIYFNEDLPMNKSLLCFKGFQRLILELRLPLDPVQTVMDLHSTPNVLKHFPDIIQNNNISAIICTSANAALKLTGQLRKMGFRVPQDVSIAAIAGSCFSAIPDFSLTYINLNFSQLGKEAVRLASEAPKGPYEDVVVPCSPVISGSSLAAPKFDPANKKLAIALYLKDHPTLRVARAGFLNMAQQMGYQAEVVATADEDEEAYLRICQSLTQLDVAGVLVWLHVPKAIECLRDAGVPVVCLHSITRQTPSSGWKACISPDPQRIAENVASFFAERFHGKRGRLSISQSTSNLLEDSISSTLIRIMQKKCPEITVTRDLLFAYHTSDTARMVTQFVEETPDLLGAFSTCGLAAITWTMAKKTLGRSDMVVVGTDYDDDSIALVKRGDLDAFVAQPIYEEAQQGVVVLDALLRGKHYEQFTQLDSPLVTKENVEKYGRLMQSIKNWYV